MVRQATHEDWHPPCYPFPAKARKTSIIVSLGFLQEPYSVDVPRKACSFPRCDDCSKNRHLQTYVPFRGSRRPRRRGPKV